MNIDKNIERADKYHLLPNRLIYEFIYKDTITLVITYANFYESFKY